MTRSAAPDISHPELPELTLSACNAAGKYVNAHFTLPATLSENKNSAELFKAVCEASGVRYRKVALRNGWQHGDCGALVGFEKETKRPMALLPAKPGRYEVFDPSSGARTPVSDDAPFSLQPFAYMFYPGFPDRPLNGRDLIRSIWTTFSRDLKIVAAAGIVAGLILLAIPMAAGVVFKKIVPESDSHMLVLITTALLVSVFAGRILDLARGYALVRLQTRWTLWAQAAIWDRMLRLPLPFFRRFTVGDLVARASMVDRIQEIAGAAAVTAIIGGLASCFNLILLFYFSPTLAAAAILFAALMILATGLLVKRIVVWQRKAFEENGRLNGFIYQFITGIAKTRVAGADERMYRIWRGGFEQEKTSSYRAGLYQMAASILNAAAPATGTLIIFMALGQMHIQAVNAGTFIAFNTALTVFLSSAILMSEIIVHLAIASPAIGRLNPILEAEPETQDSKKDPGALSGHISVENISFKYQAQGPDILKQVSWEARPGEFIALAGPSGSGKSTMLRLLLGFEYSDSGSICYDARALSDIDIFAVRRQTGVVLQTSKLVPGDILTNIIGASSLTTSDAWEAAEMAGLADDIRDMPMGMYTMINEGATTLSGGQRQRILIARAIARKPRIIFFDEATSALDNKSQKIVSQSLEKIKATRIVVAHRLSTIINADKILVMEHGEIVQAGTYEQLIKEQGLFQKIAHRQIV